MTVKYDRFYAESATACGQPFAPFADVAASLPAPASVLDLGCGQGRDAVLFGEAGHRVHGVDISSVGIAQLAALAKSEGLAITAEVADVCTYEPPATYDAVLLDRVLHMLPDHETRAAVLGRAAAATKPGGLLLISEYPKQHAMLTAFFAERPAWEILRDSKGFLFARAPQA